MPIRRQFQRPVRLPVDERFDAYMTRRSRLRQELPRVNAEVMRLADQTERRESAERRAARFEARAQALQAMDRSLYGRIMRAPSSRPAPAALPAPAMPRVFRRYPSDYAGTRHRRPWSQ